MSLLFNMLSRLAIAFIPRSKPLLISWLQSPSAVIWAQLSFTFPSEEEEENVEGNLRVKEES